MMEMRGRGHDRDWLGFFAWGEGSGNWFVVVGVLVFPAADLKEWKAVVVLVGLREEAFVISCAKSSCRKENR